jgi:hypothetical protein
MKNLSLDFPQRLRLGNFLAQTSGALGKIAALGRIYEAVRFSDEEWRQIRVQDLGNGTSNVEPPSPEFGRLETQLEDSDCPVLLQDLDSHQGFHLTDVAWVNAVKAQLASASVPVKRRE